ncbi:MAG: undecaprenyl-phosphate glucose phosphotransferase, partial [Maribacter sp.]
MKFRNSFFIIPISLLFHMATINLLLYVFTPETYLNAFSIVYVNVTWVMVTHMLNFYPTARREGFMTNFSN